MPFIDANNGLTDTSGQPVNPVQDETILLLRRLVQLSQTLATQDANNRLRVSVDAWPSTLTTVSNVSNIGTIGSVDPRFQFIDNARQAYEGLRNKITFS
jgi:hypothetical protein